MAGGHRATEGVPSPGLTENSGDGVQRVIRDAFAMMPIAGQAFAAMSLRTRASLLNGLDPVLVLEAASTVLADVENRRVGAILGRLPTPDQRTLSTWSLRVSRQGLKAAPMPLHPLAALAATRLALAQSRPGVRSDSERERIAHLLVRVGMRFNADVVNDGLREPAAVLASIGRATLWRAVEDEDWMIWAGEIVDELAAMPAAASLLATFREAAGLTLQEWWYRGLGERATRATQGARSWGGTDQVDPRIEEAWSTLAAVTVEEAVDAARIGVARSRRTDPPAVVDPYDLSWLASRPVIRTNEGRRFQVWLGANNRCLLPAGTAQVVAEVTSKSYDGVAELVGRAAERLLTDYVHQLPTWPDVQRRAEAEMPAGISKCDYLIEAHDVLLGLEFTICTPSRALSSGAHEAVGSLASRFADKFEQVYSAFRWRDPDHRKRWLPLLVLASPTVVDSLLNERVHEQLVQRGVAEAGVASELMTCYVPDFLDLLAYCESSRKPLIGLVQGWRDCSYRGNHLDFWLAEQEAHRLSGRTRIIAVVERASAILASPATQPEV